MTVRKMTLLIATLRASARYTPPGASPTRPMKIKAEPSGFTNGSSALKASTNVVQRRKRKLRTQSYTRPQPLQREMPSIGDDAVAYSLRGMRPAR